jgi:Fic family protein
VQSPSPAVTKVLRQDGLILEVAGRRAWILVPGKPTDRRIPFLANYWPVVSLVLERYAPAAIAGVEAVKLLLGDWAPPEILPAYHAANQSEYLLALEPGFSLRLRPRHLPTDRIEQLDGPGRARIPVLSAPDVLVTLDEREIAAGVEPVSAWLRHLVIRAPELERAVENWPRPQVLQRLADMASMLGNTSLGKQLDAVARRMSGRTATPARTGVGSRIQIPAVLLDEPRGGGSPWLDEQAMRLARQRAETDALLGDRLAKLPAFPMRRLIANATAAKAYDAYHSTTMEGYRISPEIVESIVRGEPATDGPQDAESLRAAMAVQGYSVAFDHVLQLAKARTPITASMILDLYEDLFRPSVDAGIIKTGELRGWRTSAVGLRGWRHVPPNPKKIRDLIDGLGRFAARTDSHPVVSAAIVHLEFVTIHPFLDGNGRLGRLLMNLALLEGGSPWVTIRADERMPFFKSIETAQVDGDTEPFIRYLWHQIRQATSDLEKQSRRTARRHRPSKRG